MIREGSGDAGRSCPKPTARVPKADGELLALAELYPAVVEPTDLGIGDRVARRRP